MDKLIKAELYKLHKLHAFHIIFLLILAIGILQGFSPYTGYQVYSICLVPELFDAVLVSCLTAVFLCTEFSSRTFGNAFLCGASRREVFLAKLAVYFWALLLLILILPALSTAVAASRNGFGADWDNVALEMELKLFAYILCRFSMAGFSILVALAVQRPVGTLGISVAGIYLMELAQSPVENSVTQNMFLDFITKTAIFLFAAATIFIRRDLK